MPLRNDLLPPPRAFFEKAIGQLTRPNRKDWALGNCPFHKSKSRRSLSVNLASGFFHCFGCDARGDLVKFVMRRDSLNFKAACKRLGAWEENGQKRTAKPRPRSLVQYFTMDFVIDGVEYHARLEDEPKTELQLLRRIHAEASDRLSEIRQGDPEKFEGEEECQWSVLANSWELIEMEARNGR
jgi:hypothetical protein